jgi:hypothetical protein
MAYGYDLPSVGRRRASPVMAWDPFLPAAARSTQVVCTWQSASPCAGREVRDSRQRFIKRAVTGAPTRPKMPSPGVVLPGPFVTPPSPVPPVATPWLRTSTGVVEFEQDVLHGCGPAQVGFGDRLSSFHRLTLSSRGRLSPEPLRLTRPFGADRNTQKAQPENSRFGLM